MYNDNFYQQISLDHEKNKPNFDIRESIDTWKISVDSNIEKLKQFHSEIKEDVILNNVFEQIYTDEQKKTVFSQYLGMEDLEKEFIDLFTDVNNNHDDYYNEGIRDWPGNMWKGTKDEDGNLLPEKLMTDKAGKIFKFFAFAGMLHFLFYFIIYFGLPILKVIQYFFFSFNISAGSDKEDDSGISRSTIYWTILAFIVIWKKDGIIVMKNNIGLIIKAIGEFFNTPLYVTANSKEAKVRKNVVFGNFGGCREKCGADFKLSRVDARQLQNAFRDIIIYKRKDADIKLKKGNYPFEQKMINQAECLIKCTLDFMATLYAELAAKYTQCMRNTGEFINDTDTLTNAMLLKYPVGEECSLIYKELNKTFENFKDILEIVYKDDAGEITYWYGVIDKKVNDAKRGTSMRPNTFSKMKFGNKIKFNPKDVKSKQRTFT